MPGRLKPWLRVPIVSATQQSSKWPHDHAANVHIDRNLGKDRIAWGRRTVKWSARQAWDFLPEFFARLSIRRDSGPIDTTDALCRFVSTRSAFVAQKTLYGYLKTRMGTRYPSMFADDVYVASIDIAKMHVFAACLSDLTVYAVARALRGSPDAAAHRALAERCFDAGLADNDDQAQGVAAFSAADAKAAFARRTAFVDWQAVSPGPAQFTESPAALVEWAPIAPELKRDDVEIIENSIKFTWRDVRAQFEKRIDGPAIRSEQNSTERAGH